MYDVYQNLMRNRSEPLPENKIPISVGWATLASHIHRGEFHRRSPENNGDQPRAQLCRSSSLQHLPAMVGMLINSLPPVTVKEDTFISNDDDDHARLEDVDASDRDISTVEDTASQVAALSNFRLGTQVSDIEDGESREAGVKPTVVDTVLHPAASEQLDLLEDFEFDYPNDPSAPELFIDITATDSECDGSFEIMTPIEFDSQDSCEEIDDRVDYPVVVSASSSTCSEPILEIDLQSEDDEILVYSSDESVENGTADGSSGSPSEVFEEMSSKPIVDSVSAEHAQDSTVKNVVDKIPEAPRKNNYLTEETSIPPLHDDTVPRQILNQAGDTLSAEQELGVCKDFKSSSNQLENVVVKPAISNRLSRSFSEGREVQASVAEDIIESPFVNPLESVVVKPTISNRLLRSFSEGRGYVESDAGAGPGAIPPLKEVVVRKRISILQPYPSDGVNNGSLDNSEAWQKDRFEVSQKSLDALRPSQAKWTTNRSTSLRRVVVRNSRSRDFESTVLRRQPVSSWSLGSVSREASISGSVMSGHQRRRSVSTLRGSTIVTAREPSSFHGTYPPDPNLHRLKLLIMMIFVITTVTTLMSQLSDLGAHGAS